MNEKKIIEISKISQELMAKAPDIESPIDYVDSLAKEYEAEVLKRLEQGKKEFPFNDFFIQVDCQKFTLVPNAFRYYYTARISCPTPNYDQIVYMYDRKKDALEFIWVVPDRGTCFMLLQNESDVEEKELMRYVKDFEDGTLGLLCKKLNNEAPDSPEIILFNKE